MLLGVFLLKLSEEVIDIYYSRNTVGEVYASIEADLKKSNRVFKLLSSPRKNAQHGSIDACYALLSRVYLYMERYEDCIEVANKIEGYGVKSLSSFACHRIFLQLWNPWRRYFPTGHTRRIGFLEMMQS